MCQGYFYPTTWSGPYRPHCVISSNVMHSRYSYNYKNYQFVREQIRHIIAFEIICQTPSYFYQMILFSCHLLYRGRSVSSLSNNSTCYSYRRLSVALQLLIHGVSWTSVHDPLKYLEPTFSPI